MTSAPAALSQPIDRESEVREAEQRITDEEHALASELAGMVDHAVALQRRINRLRTTLCHAGSAHLEPEEKRRLVTRVQEHALPVLRIGHLREEALEARLAAVTTRLEACRAIRAAIHACSAQLEILDDDVSEDETRISATRGASPKLAETLTDALERAWVEADCRRIAKLRSAPRVALAAEVSYTSENNFYSGLTANIGVGGVFIATADLLRVGTPLDLYLRMPDGRQVETKARVRWVREQNELTPNVEPGMGVEFDALSPAEQETIRAFIECRQPLRCEE